MAAKNEVTAQRGVLMSLFNKPKTDYVGREGEQITVTPQPTDMIFIRNCKHCKFGIHGKAAKCIIESSTDVRVDFEEPLMTGTLELISSQEVTVSINPQDKLPTVTAERCDNVHLYYYEPRALGAIYTVKCNNVFVHLQPPYPTELPLQLPPPDESNDQFVSTYKPQGKQMTSVKVIREGGGYVTTEEELKRAKLLEKQMERQVEAYLSKLITITKKSPSAGKPASVPAAQGGTAPKSPAATTTTAQPPATSATSESTKPKEKQQSSLPSASSEPEGDPTPSPSQGEEDPNESPLAAALRAKRGDLKPTETVERTLPVVGVGRGPGSSGRGLTNIQDEEEKREFFDSEGELSHKLDKIAQWIRDSKYTIMFTGAGVSTSCGIPDFRSGMNTVLSTGPGVWELMAHDASRPKEASIKPILQALPSPSHMAMVKLHEEGLVKFTISQNVDGLHRRSGLPASQLAELHGNTNLETCQQCGRQYFRDFETREAAGVFNHMTSRLCDDPNCRGVLYDSIINFGENLPEKELTAAMEHSKKADLCIVLGSSLRVRPACLMPQMVQENGGKLIICNLQRIPQHPGGPKEMQVFAKCDDFMAGLMQRLQLDIPSFALKRRVRISTSTAKGDDGQSMHIAVTGLDNHTNQPYSFIKGIEVDGKAVGDEPLEVTLSTDSETTSTVVAVTLTFHGHYNEPSVCLHCPVGASKVYDLTYDLSNVAAGWKITKREQ